MVDTKADKLARIYLHLGRMKPPVDKNTINITELINMEATKVLQNEA